jgi:hypothetical protein
MLNAASQGRQVPELAIFSSPLAPYDSEVLYFAPGTAEFLRPILLDVPLEQCAPPSDPDDIALLFHYGVENAFVKHFGRMPTEESF